MAESTSDWDSMSEGGAAAAAAEDDGAPGRAARDRGATAAALDEGDEHRRKKKKKAPPPRMPPYDFSGEAPREAVGKAEAMRSAPGRDRPRKADGYKPTRGEEVGVAASNRFSSPNPSSRVRSEAAGSHSREDTFAASQNTVIMATETKAGKKNRRKNRLMREDTDAQFSNVELTSTSSPAEAAAADEDEDEEGKHRASSGGAGSSSRASGAPGVDNPAFQGSFDIEERADSYANYYPSAAAKSGGGHLLSQPQSSQPLPRPEGGSIYVYRFEDPSPDGHFQVELDGGGASSSWAERSLAPPLVQCCSWCMAEVTGVLKVPFVLLFVVLGQIVMFFLDGLLRPCSDFVLKPSLASAHNSLAVPLCGCARNLCRLASRALSPACRLGCCSEARRMQRGGGDSHEVLLAE